MMNRCYTPTNKDYPAVGGKGIAVCERWHDYNAFVSDMGEKPEGAVFTRHIGGANFTPENAYWAPKVNSRDNPVYGIWKGIRRRCGTMGRSVSPQHAGYRARGVTICDEWDASFHVFAKAVGPRPSPQHQLDRIDNTLGYEPGNVRWATPKENANNRSDNIVIEMLGERRTLQQWAEHFGVPQQTVRARFASVFNPSYNRQRVILQQTAGGEVVAKFRSIRKAAESSGVGYSAIAKCLSGANKTAGGWVWAYQS